MSVTLEKALPYRNGDRVRITRTAPDGRVKFIKSGVMDQMDSTSFRFTEDVDSSSPGRRVYLRLDGVGMPGWTQRIERLQRDDAYGA